MYSLIVGIFMIAILAVVNSDNQIWKHEPGNLEICEGQDLELGWEYSAILVGKVEGVTIRKNKTTEILRWHNTTLKTLGERVRIYGRAGMVLINTTIRDTGEYTCMIFIYGASHYTSTSKVTVLKGSNAACTEDGIKTEETQVCPTLSTESHETNNHAAIALAVFLSLVIGAIIGVVVAVLYMRKKKRHWQQRNGHPHSPEEAIPLIEATELQEEVTGATQFLKARVKDRMERLNRNQNLKYNVPQKLFYLELTITNKSDVIDEEHLRKSLTSDNQNRSIQLDEIIKEEDDTMNKPNIILAVGPAGIGKSSLSQKLGYQWSKGKLWNGMFEFVFHLQCRDIAELFEGKSTSLKAILERCIEWKEGTFDVMMQYISDKRERVLFILDGLDELSQWTRAANAKTFCKIFHYTGEGQVSDIVNSLMCGHLLSGTFIIITSRPIAYLNRIKADLCITIHGFGKSSIEKCLKELCSAEHFQRVRNHIENNIAVFNMCVIPFFCVLFGAIANKCLKDNKEIETKSMTQILIYAVRHLLGKRNEEDKNYIESMDGNIRDDIRKMCQLAASGTLNEKTKLIYSEKDLKDEKVEERFIEDYGMLKCHNDNNILDMQQKKQFSYIHFMIQEFLTAVHVCITWKEDDIIWLRNNNVGNVLLFIAGLLGDTENGHKLLSDLQDKSQQPDLLARGSEFIDILCHDQEQRKMAKLQIIRCLHEGWMNEKVMDIIIKKTVISPSGRKLRLYNMTGGLLPHHMAAIGWFTQEIKCVKKLMLNRNSISPTGIETLISPFTSDTWERFMELNLYNNDIGDEGAEILGKELPRAVNLETLDLVRNELTDRGAIAIADGLQNSTKLTGLHLQVNGITDEGADHLVRKLGHLEVRIWLGFNQLTDKKADDLYEQYKIDTERLG